MVSDAGIELQLWRCGIRN